VISQLAEVTAGICYDVGDLPSLQRALEVLTLSSRRLLNVHEPLLAARLLNDQAAIYVRLGDAVRATHLLSQSRQLFEARLRTHPDDVMAIEEMAETDHLFARLLLHAQARPGREAEAYTVSLRHASAAEQAYQRLEQPHKLARVWESMGRLELQRGQLQAAQERLQAALNVQRQIGDVTGLARSTAALAELCVRTGQLEDATSLLANSIALNLEKGSPLGLAFNRRTCTTLAAAAAQAHGPSAEHLRGALVEVENRLAQAEAVLGRLVLPGETD
jgi:tetratricopeptide (TPR) repeat protein